MTENNENKMTEQQQKAQDFIKEYQALVMKYDLDFAHYPMWVPDGAGGFKTMMNVQVVPRQAPTAPAESDSFVATDKNV